MRAALMDLARKAHLNGTGFMSGVILTYVHVLFRMCALYSRSMDSAQWGMRHASSNERGRAGPSLIPM